MTDEEFKDFYGYAREDAHLFEKPVQQDMFPDFKDGPEQAFKADTKVLLEKHAQAFRDAGNMKVYRQLLKARIRM